MTKKNKRQYREQWVRVDGSFYNMLEQNCYIDSIHRGRKQKKDLSFSSWRDLTKQMANKSPEKFLNLLRDKKNNGK